jgi:hypothetical protein
MKGDSAAQLLTEAQTAAVLNLKPATLRHWRWSRSGLPFVRLGTKAIRYRAADVEAFVARGFRPVGESKVTD